MEKKTFEVYESVAAVLSKDVIQQLSEDQLETFESYVTELNGRLVRQSEMCVIYGNANAVHMAKVYLNEKMKTDISPEQSSPEERQSKNQTDCSSAQTSYTLSSEAVLCEVTDSAPSEDKDLKIGLKTSKDIIKSSVEDTTPSSESCLQKNEIAANVSSLPNASLTKKGLSKDFRNIGGRQTRGKHVDVLAVLGKRKRLQELEKTEVGYVDEKGQGTKTKLARKLKPLSDTTVEIEDHAVERCASRNEIIFNGITEGNRVKTFDGDSMVPCVTDTESSAPGIGYLESVKGEYCLNTPGDAEYRVKYSVENGMSQFIKTQNRVKDERVCLDWVKTEKVEPSVEEEPEICDHVQTVAVKEEVEDDDEGKDGRELTGDSSIVIKGDVSGDHTQKTDNSGQPRKTRVKLSKDVIRFLKKSKKKEQALKFSPGSMEESERSKKQKPNFSEEIKQLLKNNVKKEAKLKKVRLESGSTPADEVSKADRTCQLCGYVAASLQGIRLHNYTYHRDHPYQCDLCFTTFPMLHMVDRHRKHHFDSEGKLQPSAISVHKMKLAELGLEENLPPELAEQVAADDTPLPEVKYQGEELSQGDLYTTDSSVAGEWVECNICFARLSSAKFLKTHKLRVHCETKEKKKTTHVQQQVGQKFGAVVKQQYYKCPKCEFTTTRIQNYTKHYNTHSKPAFYQCDLCDYKNTIQAEITRHKRNAHSERTLPCPHCQVKFRNQPQLNAHIKIKHLKHNSQMCEECGKVLSCKYSYRQHLRTHHEDPTIQPGEKIICQNCGRLFTTVGAFHTHQEKFHADVDENLLKEPKDVSEGVLVLNGGELFQCKHCLTYTNTSAREVRLHIVRMHLEKTHTCPYCSQAFARENFLEKHIATHHLYLYNIECDECDRSFKNKSYLLFHKRRVHMKDLPFECDVCKKTFHRRGDYQSHVEIHKPAEEREWKFFCEICLKRFRHKNNLTYHMLEHTGVRAYHCPICKKSFKTKTIRNSHVLTHTEARPVECPLCEKTFKQSKYLDVHLLTHNSCSYSCKACCRLFPHLKGLEKHVCRAVKLFNPEKTDPNEGEVVSSSIVDINTASYSIQDISDSAVVDPVNLTEGYTGIQHADSTGSYPTLIVDSDTGLYNLNAEGLSVSTSGHPIANYISNIQDATETGISNIQERTGDNVIINNSLSLGSLPSVVTEDNIHITPETTVVNERIPDQSGSEVLQQLHGFHKEITVLYRGSSIESEHCEHILKHSQPEVVNSDLEVDGVNQIVVPDCQYEDKSAEQSGDVISISGNVDPTGPSVDSYINTIQDAADNVVVLCGNSQESVHNTPILDNLGGGNIQYMETLSREVAKEVLSARSILTEEERGGEMLAQAGDITVQSEPRTRGEDVDLIGLGVAGEIQGQDDQGQRGEMSAEEDVLSSSQSEVYMCGECQVICSTKAGITAHMLHYHHHPEGLQHT